MKKVGTAKCPRLQTYIINLSMAFEIKLPSFTQFKVTLQLECNKTIKTDKK